MGRRRTAALAAAAALIVPLALTSCSGGAAEQVNYAVDGVLSTYNTNTVAGAASAGPQAFARVLTGFSFHGPDGQVLTDNDFGSVSVVGREPLVVDYQISDDAVYSDGKPVVCDDMVLTWAAQSGRFPGSPPPVGPAISTSPASSASPAEEGPGQFLPRPQRR